jgi:hypothetical protein
MQSTSQVERQLKPFCMKSHIARRGRIAGSSCGPVTRAMFALAFCATTISSFVASAYQLQTRQDSLLKLASINSVAKFTNDCVSSNYDDSQTRSLHRRNVLAAVISCFSCLAVDRSGFFNDNAANAVEVVGNGVIRSKGCYQGAGDGCTELSEDNPLILQLQQQSSKNRERNEKEALYAYYMKNYPDFFNSIGQVMIKKASDDTFLLVTPQEAERLKGLGKLTYEIPKTRGGTIVDYTQKPILVLKE